jgi:hypothetical protein
MEPKCAKTRKFQPPTRKVVVADGEIEKWRLDYNEFRPHSSLGDLTPQQFVDKYKSSLRSQKTPFLAGSVFE